MDGTPFGRYQLIELLGCGGMGEVWRAYDTTIDRVVALKMLLSHFAEDPDFDKRFRREARIAARLDDPHVVPIHDVGEIDGRLYVTMRLINGVDLDTLLKSGPLKPERAVHIIEQIAGALHSAHRAGLVHRDVKPSNIGHHDVRRSRTAPITIDAEYPMPTQMDDPIAVLTGHGNATVRPGGACTGGGEFNDRFERTGD